MGGKYSIFQGLNLACRHMQAALIEYVLEKTLLIKLVENVVVLKQKTRDKIANMIVSNAINILFRSRQLGHSLLSPPLHPPGNSFFLLNRVESRKNNSLTLYFYFC